VVAGVPAFLVATIGVSVATISVLMLRAVELATGGVLSFAFA
jgi:hypothetical protein